MFWFLVIPSHDGFVESKFPKTFSCDDPKLGYPKYMEDMFFWLSRVHVGPFEGSNALRLQPFQEFE